MATMKPSEKPEGEEPSLKATSMTGYNRKIDAIRDEEFPMLQGRLAEVQTLGARSSCILQERLISTTQAQLYTPNLSWMNSPKT